MKHGPLYQQIALAVRESCVKGEFRAGTQLPTEHELMERFMVSRVTVRRALKELTETGLLEARQGSGYTVKQTLSLPLNNITSFTEDCRARGLTPGSTVIGEDHGLPTESEQRVLGLSDGEEVWRLKRLRTGDAAPLAIDHVCLPASVAKRLTWPPDSLYQALHERRLSIVRVQQQYLPVVADDQAARLLDVTCGDPLMLVTRVSELANGRTVEYANCWFRPDRWQFSHEIFQ